MTSEGNVGDTGILQEAQRLINTNKITMCEALEILMEEARKKMTKIEWKKLKEHKNQNNVGDVGNRRNPEKNDCHKSLVQ